MVETKGKKIRSLEVDTRHRHAELQGGRQEAVLIIYSPHAPVTLKTEISAPRHLVTFWTIFWSFFWIFFWIFFEPFFEPFFGHSTGILMQFDIRQRFFGHSTEIFGHVEFDRDYNAVFDPIKGVFFEVFLKCFWSPF